MADFARRKDANFNYEILEKFEAGIKLSGHEVKAVRNGKISLDGSYVIVRGNECFLINTRIEPYQASNSPENYEPSRVRKLLFNKSEIQTLIRETKSRGTTLIPLSVYAKGEHIKISVALAKGKKSKDKRQTIKKRESDIEVRRLLK